MHYHQCREHYIHVEYVAPTVLQSSNETGRNDGPLAPTTTTGEWEETVNHILHRIEYEGGGMRGKEKAAIKILTLLAAERERATNAGMLLGRVVEQEKIRTQTKDAILALVEKFATEHKGTLAENDVQNALTTLANEIKRMT